jgi:hypothetical protein
MQETTMAGNNGRDPMSGFPWWLKAVVVIGVPSAIALGLVWSDRTQLRDTVFENGSILKEIRVTDAAHGVRMEEGFRLLDNKTAETNRILLAGCVNSAKTPEQRDRCVGR